MSLPDQARFRAALMSPGAAVPEGLRDGAGRPAGKRFDVYRNNVAVSLTEALHQGFPVIARLLGKANMDGLAGIFLRAHPPADPRMMLYGAQWPAFLESTKALSHLPYLGDVARLELALRRSYHARDAAPLDASALAAIPPEDLMRSGAQLAPAAAVLRSKWPVFSIWLRNTRDDAPKPQMRAEDALIVRPGFDPEPHLLPAGGAAFIDALQGGATVSCALDRAGAGFDPTATLGLLIAGGVLISLTVKD